MVGLFWEKLNLAAFCIYQSIQQLFRLRWNLKLKTIHDHGDIGQGGVHSAVALILTQNNTDKLINVRTH